MKHNVVIAAGGQVFEFEGEILELEEDYLILRAKRGDIYIERKYLVFVQNLNDENHRADEEAIPTPVVRSPKIDHAVKFINKRLKHDPLEQRLNEQMVPPSQFPDDITEYDSIKLDEDDNREVASNVAAAFYGRNNPITKASNLRQAAQIAMNNEEEDFTMGMGATEYRGSLQAVLGLKNASNKKTRDS